MESPASPFTLAEPGSPELADRPDDLAEAIRQVGGAVIEAERGRARRRVIDFAGTHPDALHRSCLQGHLTGSAFVIDAAGERALLLHHAKLDRWLQPGGHADGDGNLAGVAWREATEETGLAGLRLVLPAIDLDIHAIPARPGEPEHLHLDLRFAAVAPEGATVAHNHEALGARWVDADDPAVTGSPDLVRAVSRALTVVRALR
ncbi:MAG: NUDIX hydrolase [Actinomycetota bacterium]